MVLVIAQRNKQRLKSPLFSECEKLNKEESWLA